MTTARPARTALVAGFLLAGSLAACGTDAGAEIAAPPDLRTALTLDVKGFEPAAAPEPPSTVCRDGDYDSDSVPTLPGSLGEPTSVGYSAHDAELHAWAWRTATLEAAGTVVDEAVADLEGGRFYGGGAELVESRFVRNGDVVVLVVLTIHGNDDALVAGVDAYLEGVAARLR
jgi:hypothetical protein